MNLVLLGPPGAGKGTLASLLKSSLKIEHVSTGDILREQIKKNTDLGKEVKIFIDSGRLVPDELVTKLIENKLTVENGAKKGFMLDGFPRTKAQAMDLDKILNKIHQPLDYVISMESTLPIIILRLTGRRVCRKCGATFHVKNRPPKQVGVCDFCHGELYQRPDDNETTIKTRMEVYLSSTLPILEYYKAQGIIKTLDSDKESEGLQAGLIKLFHDEGKFN